MLLVLLLPLLLGTLLLRVFLPFFWYLVRNNSYSLMVCRQRFFARDTHIVRGGTVSKR